MKRRFGWVLPALVVLTVVLAGYTVAAAVLLRGLGAYRMGTGLGRALAVSRPWTLAAAAVLAAGLLVRLALRRRRKARAAEQESKLAPAAPTELMPGSAGKKIAPARPVPEKKPARKGRKAAAVERLAPTAAELEGRGKIAPAAPEKKPEPAATVPMGDTAQPPEQAPADTVLLPKAAPEPAPADTVLLPKAAPAAPEKAPVLPEGGPRVCAVCGAPLKAGQKFCTKCGAQAQEGGTL